MADLVGKGEEELVTESVETPVVVFEAVIDPVGDPVAVEDFVAEGEAVMVAPPVVVGDAVADLDTADVPVSVRSAVLVPLRAPVPVLDFDADADAVVVAVAEAERVAEEDAVPVGELVADRCAVNEAAADAEPIPVLV